MSRFAKSTHYHLAHLASFLLLNTVSCLTQTVAAAEISARFGVGDSVYVRSLGVEQEAGLIWIGTSSGVLAVDLASENVRHTFNRDSGLANEYIFAIGFDDRGNKWFGTNAGGASTWNDGTWKTWFPMHGLADYWVYAFEQQQNGAFWIGTWEGASRVDLESMTFTTFHEELINEWVYGLAVDSRDRVWFGTEGGISMLDGDSWSHWNHDDGVGAPNTRELQPSTNTGLGTRNRHDLNILSVSGETYNPNYVFSMHVTPDDIVWAGTWGGGLARYDGNAWRNYSSVDGLAGDVVYAITSTPDGRIWVGTNRGISILDGNRWNSIQRYNTEELADVYALAVTPQGDVWAGLKGSVVKISTQ